MVEWKNVTDTFSEEQRHYNGKYLEIDEVYNDEVEVSVFSADDEPYEIYLMMNRMKFISVMINTMESFMLKKRRSMKSGTR